MSFNWDSYLKFASELKNEKDEAKLRCAVSRGYYGAYHKTRNKLKFTSSEFVNHEKLIDSLRRNTEIKKSSTLANQLDALKQDRVKADYKTYEKIDVSFVTIFWARLERYLDKISAEEED
jgi:uncharacterized protein (UPF0332 family)